MADNYCENMNIPHCNEKHLLWALKEPVFFSLVSTIWILEFSYMTGLWFHGFEELYLQT